MNKLQQLFWEAFVKNCKLDNEDLTEEDLESVKRMDRSQILKALKTFIDKLLDFKDKVKTLEVRELVDRVQKFEIVITKLESDVRAHIGLHYQLKLEIESLRDVIQLTNKELSESRTEIKRLRTKIVLQEKIIEKFKEKFEGKRKNRKIKIETENEVEFKGRGVGKSLTERAKSSSALGKTLGFVRSKSRIAHLRTKSELSKSGKVKIPLIN